MTTKLHKVVKRQTQDAYPERHTYGKRRPIVIELHPNGIIGLRRSGLRSAYYVEACALISDLEWKEAKAMLLAKRKAKKERSKR